MKNRYLVGTLIVLTLGLLAGPRPVAAEDEPTPGVARVSVIHGDVSMMRGDSGDWAATTVNAPLVEGDKITTGERSRAEVQLDFANILRLDQRSEVRIAELSRTRIQLQVAQGTINFTVFKGTEAQVEIATPNMAVQPLGEGNYRIQVNTPTETQVMVRNGKAEAATPQGSAIVEKNKMITVRGSDNPEYQMAKAPSQDQWDQWNKDRDKEILEAVSWSHTNRYYTGASDLDRHGRWVYVPDYDWCWTPYVNAGWVPYSYGRWVWQPYWGWTWVSYEPWGWAPYHYGRWFFHGGGWHWWPGHRRHGFYPAWAPAYVSFIGFGYGGHNWGFGVGFGFGSIGWCPLGPYDGHRPWWGRHNSYTAVNITNITNVTNINNYGQGGRGPGRGYTTNLQQAMANPDVRRAISKVSAEDFANGRMPGRGRGIDSTTLRDGHVISGTLPVVPTRESLRTVERPVNHAALPAASDRPQRFFGERQTSGRGTTFNQEASQIQRMVQTHNPLGATAPAGMTARGGAAAATGRTAEGTPGRTAQPGLRETPTAGTAPNANQRPQGQGSAGVTVPPAANRPTVTAPGQVQGGQTASPGWKRFEGGNQRTNPAPGQIQRPTNAPASNPQGNRSAAGQTAGTVSPAARGPQSTTTQAPASVPRQAAPSGAGGERSGWQQFGTAARPATSTNSPSQAAPARSGTTGFARPAPQGGATGQSGWQKFSQTSRPTTTTSPSTYRQGSSAPVTQPGWNRFTPQPRRAAPRQSSGGAAAPSRGMSTARTSQGSTYQSAPRSTSSRPPLQIQRSIVTQRSAPAVRSSGSGGNRGGSWGSSGSGSRSGNSGGGRSSGGGGRRR